MPLKFDITLTAEDMYRFNMYQTYSGFHGWFSIVFSIQYSPHSFLNIWCTFFTKIFLWISVSTFFRIHLMASSA